MIGKVTLTMDKQSGVALLAMLLYLLTTSQSRPATMFYDAPLYMPAAYITGVHASCSGMMTSASFIPHGSAKRTSRLFRTTKQEDYNGTLPSVPHPDVVILCCRGDKKYGRQGTPSRANTLGTPPLDLPTPSEYTRFPESACPEHG